MLTFAIRVVANLSDEVHWLCDTIEKDAAGKIAVCEDDVETRQEATFCAVMLLSFSDQEVNQEWLKRRIAEQLARCSRCVREFYLQKKKCYQKLLPCVLLLGSLVLFY